MSVSEPILPERPSIVALPSTVRAKFVKVYGRSSGGDSNGRNAASWSRTVVSARSGEQPAEGHGLHDPIPLGEPQQPSFLAASRRFLTSTVGFFWLLSSFSPRRLIQMTGTRILISGSTSV